MPFASARDSGRSPSWCTAPRTTASASLPNSSTAGTTSGKTDSRLLRSARRVDSIGLADLLGLRPAPAAGARRRRHRRAGRGPRRAPQPQARWSSSCAPPGDQPTGWRLSRASSGSRCCGARRPLAGRQGAPVLVRDRPRATARRRPAAIRSAALDADDIDYRQLLALPALGEIDSQQVQRWLKELKNSAGITLDEERRQEIAEHATAARRQAAQCL
jgi:hypothetical protein